MLSYAKTSEDEYFVSFVDVRLKSIMEDMMLMNFLAINPRASYLHYIQAAKMRSKHMGELSPVANLCRGLSEARGYGHGTH